MLPRQKFRFKRTTLITVGLVAFLAGIGLSKLNIGISLYWLIVVGIIVLTSTRRKRYVSILAIIMFGVLAGMIRGNVLTQKLAPYQDLYGHKVVLQVTAKEDAAYTKRSQLGFEANKVKVIEPFAAELPGRIKVAGFGESMVYHGDVVQVEGRLSKIRGGRQGQMSFAEMRVLQRNDSTADTVRRNFAAGMQNALPEPLASFGLGILIGQRSTLPAGTTAMLAVVGLTHIVAVSGYNLTIIVDAVRRLTSKRSKYQSAFFAVILISLFLLMTGMSAPIVRAAIVSGLGIAAWYYGRNIKPVLLIALAASLTAGWNPLYLWGDIGWYLSFLAFFGVLVIAPLLAKRLYRTREPGFISSILLQTICAQIMTLPLILYLFQQISLVSIISNLLVVPMVPFAMLLSLIAGTAGMLTPLLAGWLAWPAKILLTYMLDIASLMSRVPYALAHYSLPLTDLLVLYALIVLCVIVLGRKVKQASKHDTITETESIKAGA